jgi:hypothetical protein
MKRLEIESMLKGQKEQSVMTTFNYKAPAELFPGRSRTRRPIGFRRFDTAAEAIRFAVEQMPAELLIGSVLEADVVRVSGPGIRQLYDSAEYPLTRKAS